MPPSHCIEFIGIPTIEFPFVYYVMMRLQQSPVQAQQQAQQFNLQNNNMFGQNHALAALEALQNNKQQTSAPNTPIQLSNLMNHHSNFAKIIGAQQSSYGLNPIQLNLQQQLENMKQANNMEELKRKLVQATGSRSESPVVKTPRLEIASPCKDEEKLEVVDECNGLDVKIDVDTRKYK